MKKSLIALALVAASLHGYGQDVLTINNTSGCTITVKTILSQASSWGASACSIYSNTFGVGALGFYSANPFNFQTSVGFSTPPPLPVFTSTSYPHDFFYTDIAFDADCGGCPTISGSMNSGPLACLGGTGMSFTGTTCSGTLHASWSYSTPNVTINFW